MNELEPPCILPSILWTTSSDVTERTWLSKTRYQGDSGFWVDQRHMTVTSTQLEVRLHTPVTCQDYEGTGSSCHREEHMYSRRCVKTAAEKTFVMVQNDDG